jgi:hypothetical protein
MSSRKSKKEKAAAEGLRAVPLPAPVPEKDPGNIEAAKFRIAQEAVWHLESAALNMREVTRFDPPDPAGPPNKHVVMDLQGPDFDMIGVIRKRTLVFMQKLDRYEDATRYILDHPGEIVTRADIPEVHKTLTFTPDTAPAKRHEGIAVVPDPEPTA